MRLPFAHSQPALPQGGYMESSREGRDCDRCRRLTFLVLFPRFERPGPWLLLLTAVCSFVAIRALEMWHF